MCTAISWRPKEHYFGRNLDLEYSYDETVTLTPRRFPLEFRHLPTLPRHHAILGTAFVQQGYPLYYDAMNEAGLCMAGLRFAASAVYTAAEAGKENVASFELIPYLLARCSDLTEVRTALSQIRITDAAFSRELPPSPLHWIIADESGALTVEQTAAGLQIYDNPAGVLTNEPPFPAQLCRLADHMQCSPLPPENRLAPDVPLIPYSRGMGAMGLPGDSSSASRFVRAAFHRAHAVTDGTEEMTVAQFFRLLQNAAQIRGCVKTEDGQDERTVYSSCCSARRGIYYYTTEQNSAVTAVDLRLENVEGSALISYPMLRQPRIFLQNGKS